MNPDAYLEEPEHLDYETLDAEQDTRASDDADAHRKGEKLMLKFFKRRRPAHRATVPAPRLDVKDLLVARWHGLTPEQWCDLPSLAKVDHRETYARAWRL